MIQENQILFEDDDIIILNKWAGIPMHATLDKKRENLTSLVAKHINTKDDISTHISSPHRLDKDTTGVAIFTKNKTSNAIISDCIRNKTINKLYVTITMGCLAQPRGVLQDFLKINNNGKVTVVKSGGQKAITEYETLETIDNHSFIFLKIITGRTHQIRIQTSSRGAAIVGDSLYGNKKFNHRNKITRQLLHALAINFEHPVTGKNILVYAPIPDDMKAYLNKIGSKIDTDRLIAEKNTFLVRQ